MTQCSSAVFRLAVLAVLLCHTDAAVVTSTPIDRVIGLLGKIEAQIQREGTKEAAEYDKYSCYCKEQADNTLYAIENSKEKISVLSANIEQLDADIKELDASIKELKETIATKKKDIETAEGKRKTTNEAYVKEATEIVDAIDAVTEAIKELKSSKKDMKNAKLNLLQGQLLELLSSSSTAPSASQLRAVEALVQAPPSSAKHHAYEYRSNDIIGTLEHLLAEFKSKKDDCNVDEKKSLFAFEEKKQALENERDFAEKDKTEKESVRADKKEDRANKKEDKDAEEKALKADEGFMKEITSDCESKAAQFDQRSRVRADELTAINSAMGQLKGGVSGNYGSNALAAGASFLQTRRGSGASATTLAKVTALISADAKRLQSASLIGLTLKLRAGGHFDKVVGLIKDLIKKLEDEAKAAKDSKGECESNMKKAVEKRDKNKLEMEDNEATIAMKKAETTKLKGEVDKISTEIAQLQKSLLEATELRAEEKSDNQVTLEEAKSGKSSVDQAIQVLKEFYSAQFLQETAAPAKNRDGKTVEGTAPKLSYQGDYKGNQKASKGIIGILEVIASDFQRTITTTKSDESSGASDFVAFEKKTKDDVDGKNKLQKEKEDAIKKASGAITQAKDNMIDAENLMNTALEELEKVQAMCMTGEGSFAERKKQREEEIKTLKVAMGILQDWKA